MWKYLKYTPTIFWRFTQNWNFSVNFCFCWILILSITVTYSIMQYVELQSRHTIRHTRVVFLVVLYFVYSPVGHHNVILYYYCSQAGFSCRQTFTPLKNTVKICIRCRCSSCQRRYTYLISTRFPTIAYYNLRIYVGFERR